MSKLQTDLIRKNPCGKCRAAGKTVCLCGPGGGSSGGSNNSGGSEVSETNGMSNGENSNLSNQSANPTTAMHDYVLANTTDNNIAASPSNENIFNAAVILDLLDKRILKISENINVGILSITCRINLLSADQKIEFNRFIHAIQNEFVTFKKKLNLSDNNCSIQIEKVRQGNISSMTICLSNPNHYDRFIGQLKNQHLLLVSKLQQNTRNRTLQQEESESRRNNTYTSPSPYSSMKNLKPKR